MKEIAPWIISLILAIWIIRDEIVIDHISGVNQLEQELKIVEQENEAYEKQIKTIKQIADSSIVTIDDLNNFDSIRRSFNSHLDSLRQSN